MAPVRIVRPDGEIRHLRAAAEITLDAQGKLAAIFGINADVTHLVLAERALQENNAFVIAVLDSLTASVAVRCELRSAS
jgi:PAS domain-containing protein